MAYLPVSEKESAWVFLTDGDAEAALLDFNGIYVLLDGGPQPIDMLGLFRNPEVAVLSSATSTTLPNVVQLNAGQNQLPVIGRLPKTTKAGSTTAHLLHELRESGTHVVSPKHVDPKKPEPFIAFQSLRTGTVEVYVLGGEAKDLDLFQKAVDSGDEDKILDAARGTSMVSLVVFVPPDVKAQVKRVLHTGSADYAKIVESVDKLKTMPLLCEPHITVEQYRKGGVAKPPAKVAAPTRAAAAPSRAPAPSSKPTTPKPVVAPIKPAMRPAPAARAPPSKPAPASTRPAPSVASKPAARPSAAARPAASAASTRPVANGGVARSKAPALSVRGQEKPLEKRTIAPSRGAAPSKPAGAPAKTTSGPKAKEPTTPKAAPAPAPVPAPPTSPTPNEAVILTAAASISPPAPVSTPTEMLPSLLGDLVTKPTGDLVSYNLIGTAADTHASAGASPEAPEATKVPTSSEDIDTQASSSVKTHDGDEAREREPSPVPPEVTSDPHSPLPSEPAVDQSAAESPEPSAPPAEEAEPKEIEVHADEPTPGAHAADEHIPVEFKEPHAQEPVNDDGFLEVGEPPMRLRKVSMDTDDEEAKKIVDQINSDVSRAVTECEQTLERGLSQQEEPEESSTPQQVESSSLLDFSSPAQASPASDYVNHPELIDASILDSTFGDDGFSDVAAASRFSSSPPAPEPVKSTDLFGMSATPFAAGLASTIIDESTAEGAKQHNTSLFDTLVSGVHHAVDSAQDKVGHAIDVVQDKVEDVVDRMGFGSEHDEPVEHDSHKLSSDVLDTLTAESSAVDRKLSEHHEATPEEQKTLSENGHHPDVDHHHQEQSGGHATVSSFASETQFYGSSKRVGIVSSFSHRSQHLPPARKPAAVPTLSRPLYFDLAWAPRRGQHCALVDEAHADAYFSKFRASTIVLPSEDISPVVLESWLRAKQSAVDWKDPQALLPTREGPALQAMRTMKATEMAEVDASLRTALDHCTTKVEIGGSERAFNTVKVEL